LGLILITILIREKYQIFLEIFPIRNHSIYYGIAFATRTVGTFVGEGILNNKSLYMRGYLIPAMSTFPVLAALFEWVWLPDIQTRYSPYELNKEDENMRDFRPKLKPRNKQLE
jgi:hypothetical protein